jgi:hypothetical protein
LLSRAILPIPDDRSPTNHKFYQPYPAVANQVASIPPSIGRSKQSNLASFSSKAAALIPSKIADSL